MRVIRSAAMATLLGNLLVLFPGCSLFHPLGPDYHAPGSSASGLDATESGTASGTENVPANRPVKAALADHATVFSAEPLPGPWWELYDDPALNQVIEAALSANRDLRQAASHLRGAQGALDAARAAWLPSTSVAVSDERERGNEYGATGLHRFNAAAANLTIAYEIDLFGRIRRSVEAAHASLDAERYTFAATQVQVVANTVSAYALVCQSHDDLAVQQHLIDIAQQQLNLTQTLNQHGASTDVDVTRAAALLDQQRAALPPLEGKRQSSLYALAVLLGRAPADPPPQAVQCAALPHLKAPLPIGDGMALLRRRPDVQEAERNLAAATASIGVAMAAMYPQVSLGVGVGGEGTSLSGAMRASGRTWDFGPMVHWTFPNVVIARAQVREQQAAADAALAAYDAAVLNALKELDTALSSYATALQHDALLRRTRDDDQKALAQVGRLYAAGASPFIDLLDAQRTAAGAEQAVSTSAGTLASDQVAVFQALGGGWSDAAQRAAVQADTAATLFQEEVAKRHQAAAK